MLDSNRYAHLIGSDLLPQRFWDKVDIDPSGCWLWTATTTQGYGYLWARPGTVSTRAHKLAYETLVAPVPTGLVLDHLCRVRRCCNPAHVEPVTDQVNLLRGETLAAAQVRRTHCPRGHAYDAENTRTYRRNKRECRACRIERRARRRAELRAAS